MFDDDTVAFQLAVMLRTLDITLSADHWATLLEEGYEIDTAVDEAVVESLIAQQDELLEELNIHRDWLPTNVQTVEARKATITRLEDEFASFTDRLVEFTS